ncbi:MAG: hypothetical protein AB1499_12500 [Nitrospirota bacterium]
MNFIKLLPVFFSLLLMTAHFYRGGSLPLTVTVLTGLLLLIVPRRWVARMIQAMLAIGGIEWIVTMYRLVSIREAAGMPWIRLAVILGAVSMITFGSIFIFRLKSLRIRYKLDNES